MLETRTRNGCKQEENLEHSRHRRLSRGPRPAGESPPGAALVSGSIESCAMLAPDVLNYIESYPSQVASLVAEYGGDGIRLLVPTLGGAVDVIVVRQPDGSLKSSPFYGESVP